MRERPILFNGPMVRAILAGQKTQTRRVMREQVCDPGIVQIAGPGYCEIINEHGVQIPGFRCPYGQPGDRLWVRETHAIVPRTAYAASDGVQQVLRPDDEHDAAVFREGWTRSPPGRWRPSIHMPRWASRIKLEITGVRVERLQDISEMDAVAEGIRISSQARRSDACYGIYECLMPDGRTHFDDSAYELYRGLWEQINGADSWDANPWVWVVEFRRITDPDESAKADAAIDAIMERQP